MTLGLISVKLPSKEVRKQTDPDGSHTQLSDAPCNRAGAPPYPRFLREGGISQIHPLRNSLRGSVVDVPDYRVTVA